ncbi:hypothetical protein KORDIASMS9_01315 [Kordia sp. SMS9]|uniref:hypothetical protein n=1 Tax=Kordia sp. SMS9 TaxID=2282170 RepID=UPI000E0D7239|nr:hypothetical protein [Kordia sp. SMS9]AXG69096.1 hypothetical protein KORDIASMS9_01315 [Kordia sp. SMS9]
MKKQTFKNLVVHKKTISSLETLQKIHGGEDSFWPETLKFCPAPPDPSPATDIRVCTVGPDDCIVL